MHESEALFIQKVAISSALPQRANYSLSSFKYTYGDLIYALPVSPYQHLHTPESDPVFAFLTIILHKSIYLSDLHCAFDRCDTPSAPILY
jgi:hypothetical protein